MYKSYQIEDRLRITDECSERLKNLLQKRYNELEEMRNAINDRYPFEDLEHKCDEVDDEEMLIRQLLEYLKDATKLLKAKKENGEIE